MCPQTPPSFLIACTPLPTYAPVHIFSWWWSQAKHSLVKLPLVVRPKADVQPGLNFIARRVSLWMSLPVFHVPVFVSHALLRSPPCACQFTCVVHLCDIRLNLTVIIKKLHFWQQYKCYLVWNNSFIGHNKMWPLSLDFYSDWTYVPWNGFETTCLLKLWLFSTETGQRLNTEWSLAA